MAVPTGRGSARAQAEEAFLAMRAILTGLPGPQVVTFQTVFLKSQKDQAACERVVAGHYGNARPVTTYIHQPPCGGAAMSVEAWAIGGEPVRIERPQTDLTTISYDGITWTYCGGIAPRITGRGVYKTSLDGFQQIKARMKKAGVSFDHIMRTWLYLGSITGPEGDVERYMELNRARADFYRNVRFGRGHLMPSVHHGVYPASTGIGTEGRNLVMSAMALDTKRKDVFLLPLENPQQTPVYQYERVYSPKSPKFVRAMAAVIGNYVTLWVSGTASIVNSKTQHIGDPRKQTEQTIENIEVLIAPDNLARHGVRGAGAKLSDLARVRVYVKRPQDYPICREVCERRFGKVPVIYTVADVCRSDLLVEMEGLAFAQRTPVK
ncbi:MAG: hypothetical protein HZA91_19440 [Verrucomicrobia bacterium]|nr:hypothetical protein [Verrucomicrobiota bacterium]